MTHDPMPHDPNTIGKQFCDGALVSLQRNKDWADQAIAQTSDRNLHRSLSDETNPIAVIMKHVAGNLRSRWTEFLTTDGEKEWRNRDDEFVDDFTGRVELIQFWESGWKCLFDTIAGLNNEDLAKTVTIRGEPHSVPLAIQRSMTHTCYHVGQIILIARALYEGDDWNVISVPRGGSASYNARVWGKGHYNTQRNDS